MSLFSLIKKINKIRNSHLVYLPLGEEVLNKHAYKIKTEIYIDIICRYQIISRITIFRLKLSRILYFHEFSLYVKPKP